MAKGRRSSLKEAPDGGFAWVVLAACSVCMFTVISMGRIGGLVFVEIINVHQVTRTEAMTVLIVGRTFAFAAAPIAGKLLTKFDFSFILCIGGLIMSCGIILSSFTKSLWQLVITYGCIQGTGSNFIIVASTLVVGIYFKKRRSLAMGILYAVGCSGGFIMPVLFNFLLELYKFNGALLVVGAIMLHPAACGLLVRQPTWTNKANSCVKDYEFRPATTDSNENINQSSYYQKGTKTCSSDGDKEIVLFRRSVSQVSAQATEKLNPTPSFEANRRFQRSVSQASSRGTSEADRSQPVLFRFDSVSTVDEQIDQKGQSRPNSGVATPPVMNKNGKVRLGVAENERKSPNGVPEIEPFLAGPSERQALNDKKTEKPHRTLFAQVINSLKIFSDYVFILMYTNRVLLMSCLLNFNTIIPDFVYKEVKEHITPQEVAFILSMMAVGDMTGRLFVGTFLDRLPWANKHSFAGLSIIAGVVVVSLQWANSYSSLLIIAILYGIVMGSCVVVQFVLEVELMGVDRAPTAHSICQFSIGVMSMTIGFLMGYLRDSLGSYVLSINLLGGIAIVGGVIWTLEPVLQKLLPPPPAPLVKSATKASIIEPEEPPHF